MSVYKVRRRRPSDFQPRHWFPSCKDDFFFWLDGAHEIQCLREEMVFQQQSKHQPLLARVFEQY